MKQNIKEEEKQNRANPIKSYSKVIKIIDSHMNGKYLRRTMIKVRLGCVLGVIFKLL